MSHLLPIAPIKTYLCKQEFWPNDWLGVGYSEQTAFKGFLKPGMPNQRSTVPESGNRLSRKESQAPQGCSVSRDDLEMQTQSTFMLEQAECIPSQRWSEYSITRLQLTRAPTHKDLSGFTLEAVPEKPREGCDAVISQEGKFHSTKKSEQFLVFS